MKHINKRKLLGLLIAMGVLWSVLALLSNSRDVGASITHISLSRMGVVLLLSMINYVVRIIRFNWFSRRVAVRPIAGKLNTIIFFSGLSMNLTPARIGEVVKAYFQHQFFGESFARMAPIVFFERVSDAISMLILMSIGVLAFRIGIVAFVVLISCVAFLIMLLHWKAFGLWVKQRAARLPMGKKLATPLGRALTSSYELSSIVPITGGALLGVIAWITEASGLLVLINALGTTLTFSHLYLVLFVFSVSAAVGFLSILPAGLGINELSTIGLLERLLHVSYANALVATFAFRAVTLWFGILLGLASMVYLEQRTQRQIT